MKFKTNYHLIRLESDKEHPKGVSMTVPNMSYTVRELMSRHLAGTMPGIGHVGNYDEHPDFDSWDETVGDFDLVDAQEMALRLRERASEIDKERKKVRKNEGEAIRLKLKELDDLKKHLADEPNGFTLNDLKKMSQDTLKSDEK